MAPFGSHRPRQADAEVVVAGAAVTTLVAAIITGLNRYLIADEVGGLL